MSISVKNFCWLMYVGMISAIPWINKVEDNAFLKHLLSPRERKTQDVFSGILFSFAHLPPITLRGEQVL